MQKRDVLQDWTLVENFDLDGSQSCSYEYHVVQERDCRRITLTLKCFDQHARTVRLDPTVIHDSAAAASTSYAEIAERRIRHLYRKGMIGA